MSYPTTTSSSSSDSRSNSHPHSSLMLNHQQQHQPLSSSYAGRPVRSSPIAIVRPKSDSRESSSDDDDDDDDRYRLSDAHSAAAAQSLPSRLLRAPRLGSVPSREPYMLQGGTDMVLPPPMAVTSTTAAAGVMDPGPTPAYGSLRDSHSRGRFLDGPSSYRDGRTGDIRPRTLGRPRVRFDQNALSQGTGSANIASLSTSTPTISIRDRMMQARKQRQTASQTTNGNDQSAVVSSNQTHDGPPKEPTSSLSAILSASDSLPPQQEPEATTSIQPLERPFYEEDNGDSFMLSTSLTGLELLQSSSQPLFAGTNKDSAMNSSGSVLHNTHTMYNVRSYAGTDSATSTPVMTNQSAGHFEDLEELPRDAEGHNALLSRSNSDPTPHLRPRQAPSIPSPQLQSHSSVIRVSSEGAFRLDGGLGLPQVLLPPARSTNQTPIVLPRSASQSSQNPDGQATTTLTALQSWNATATASAPNVATTTRTTSFVPVPLTLPPHQDGQMSMEEEEMDANPDTEAAFDMDLE